MAVNFLFIFYLQLKETEYATEEIHDRADESRLTWTFGVELGVEDGKLWKPGNVPLANGGVPRRARGRCRKMSVPLAVNGRVLDPDLPLSDNCRCRRTPSVMLVAVTESPLVVPCTTIVSPTAIAGDRARRAVLRHRRIACINGIGRAVAAIGYRNRRSADSGNLPEDTGKILLNHLAVSSARRG